MIYLSSQGLIAKLFPTETYNGEPVSPVYPVMYRAEAWIETS